MGVKKILVADDQIGIRVLLKEILQRDGYNIYEAENGFEAVNITKTTNPDLILLDFEMPGLDGIGVLKQLSNLFINIPIIMMTGHNEKCIADVALQHGVHSIVTKPFDIYELSNLAKKLLNE